MNKVIISGNITRDIELTQLPAGTCVTTISVAVNAGYDKVAQKAKTAFIECVAFNEKAQFLQQYFSKGKPILIEGSITQDEWDDKDTGKKRMKTKVIAQRVEFFGGEKTQQGGQLQQPIQMTPPQPVQQPIQTPAPNNGYQQPQNYNQPQGYSQQDQPPQYQQG